MIHPIEKEKELAADAVKLELARKVLETAIHAIDSKGGMDLLDHTLLAEHYEKKREEERRKEQCRKVLGGLFCLAGLGTFAAFLMREVKEKKEVQEAIQDEQQKELYRKLSTIKGRNN